jgi:hypothetical protein
VDSRGIALAQYFCPTAKLGTGSFYFGTFHDHSGKPLDGGNNYRLHVPAEVPVREFWSATVYSLKTSSFFLNATRLTVSSLDKELRKNADGTVNIYFGPKPPAGSEFAGLGFLAHRLLARLLLRFGFGLGLLGPDHVDAHLVERRQNVINLLGTARPIVGFLSLVHLA